MYYLYIVYYKHVFLYFAVIWRGGARDPTMDYQAFCLLCCASCMRPGRLLVSILTSFS